MNGMMDHSMRPPQAPRGSGIGLCPAAGFHKRYVWRRVNFSRFLYDRLEDIHIPEQVYFSSIQTSVRDL